MYWKYLVVFVLMFSILSCSEPLKYHEIDSINNKINSSERTFDNNNDGVLLIDGSNVTNLNLAPEIVYVSKPSGIIYAKEDQSIEIDVIAKDFDGDEIEYLWLFDNEKISFGSELSYYLNYESSGEHELKVMVSDGKTESILTWKILIEEVNRKPFLEDFMLITIDENKEVFIEAVYGDLDLEDENLSISYGEPFDCKGSWKTNYNSAGGYYVPVTVSDSKDNVTKIAKVLVRNINRKPKIDVVERIEVKEGDMVEITPVVFDADDDYIDVHISDPVGDNGVWQTGLLDAGEYEIIVSASDGMDLIEEVVLVEVLNVNRAPRIDQIDDLSVIETDLVKIKPNVFDLDLDDELKITFSEPFNKMGVWQTDYDSEGEYEISVNVSDGDLSDETKFNLIVEKRNRPPIILSVSN